MEKLGFRESIIEFIRAYRDLPALWQVNSTDYMDRKKKADAYNVLISKYRKIDPNATRETVTKKINTLRTNYRKELRKLRDWQKIEASMDMPPTYTPTLWYFDEFAFLGQHEISEENEKAILGDVDIQQDNDDPSISCEEVVEEENCEMTTSRTIRVPTPVPAKIARKRPKKNYIPQEVLFISCEQDAKNDAEYEMYAKMWAMELKKMKPEQQIYAKKFIYEILLEGQLNALHKDAVQINTKIDSQTYSPIVYKLS